MTDDQALVLRSLIGDALTTVLGKPVAYVIVAQDESRMIEVFTNVLNRDALPSLLEEAASIVREPPAGTTEGRKLS